MIDFSLRNILFFSSSLTEDMKMLNSAVLSFSLRSFWRSNGTDQEWESFRLSASLRAKFTITKAPRGPPTKVIHRSLAHEEEKSFIEGSETCAIFR